MASPSSRSLALAALWLLAAAPSPGQSPGLDAPVPVGPFFGGAFPARTPRDPASAAWGVVPAFPNLTLDAPLVIVPGPADGRLYVGSRDGHVVAFENRPDVSAAASFLDLRDRVAVVWDGGLLGMAFHPAFGTPGSPHRGHLYVYYSTHCPIDATRRGVDLGACNASYPQGVTQGFFGTWLRLSRFTVADGESAPDPSSERVMLNIRLYNSSHRGGGMVFGDDGDLWLTIGDQFRYDTAQDLAHTLEGGILRLAVDVAEDAGGGWTCPAGSHLPRRAFASADETSGQLYCIPDGNPWLAPDGSAFEEYATIGHRNPHRLAKDPTTGRLWSGEVGESTREEVNVIALGGNYGWPFREGKIAGPRAPPATVVGTLTDPVVDFGRADASALIGGYVYRGARFPELEGRFLAGDYVTNKIWAIALTGANTAEATEIASFHPQFLGTFGQDLAGEVYLGSVAGSGPLYTLERLTDPVPDPPPMLSQLGTFTSLASLTPAPAFVPYELNSRYWSEGSRQWRWIAVPNDGVHDAPGEQIGYAPASDWSFPAGTVIMKHFELPVDETDPTATERLETGFLVKGEDGRWYGLTYRWLPDGSDARLLVGGESGDYTIRRADGGTRVQTWTFPAREQCLQCHNASTSGALGIRAHQLNRDTTYPSTGRTDHQLATWSHLGMLAPPVDPASLPDVLRSSALDDPSASLEARARSWLDVTCSSCHRPGTGRGHFDARFTTPLASQGLVYGSAQYDLGLPGSFLITPGSPALSSLFQRVASVGTGVAMPPLAKSMVQQQAALVLGAWIERIDPGFQRAGVSFDYWEPTGLSALPDFDALGSPRLSGFASTFDLTPRLRSDHFAFRFRGVVRIDAPGTYTFYTSSDDGSRLLLDGALAVDNDGLHPLLEASGSRPLSAGFHAIEVQFFERDGEEILQVDLAGPGLPRQPIPPSLLFPEVPAPVENQGPALEAVPFRVSGEREPVSFALSASDADGDALWFDARGLPPGLTLDHETGLVTGAATAAGRYDVVVGASDGPAVASIAFPWYVQPRQCNDGLDNDGDGLADHPSDPGCRLSTSAAEATACQDGVDDDGDGLLDFDGGQSIHGACSGGGCPPGVSDPEGDGVANPDPQCRYAWKTSERSSACGLGFELAFALPALAALARRRRRRPGDGYAPGRLSKATLEVASEE